MSTDMRERVERGAAFLDEVAPGWDQRIDHQALNLTDNENCVLGQVFGDFHVGLARICDWVRDTKQVGTYGLLGAHDPWNEDSLDSGMSNEWLALLVERNDSKITPTKENATA